ncbi:hypothetical protein [Mycobacterium sp. URHB0044]|jgi:hypothetical protein|uniref:hypothetical protein n=1 Tax=Mycobacterium sp. URHB0044 TaxID=1380386 RepID=UPI0012DFD757|nr:hypothetical protein [Mycobacterium sp. URHB0044]
MAPEDQEPVAGDSPPEPLKITPVVPLYQRPDSNLVAIANMAEFVGFPITFYMPWGIASGHTANPNEYYRHLGDSAVAGTLPDDVPEGWADAIAEFAEINFYKYSRLTPSERAENVMLDGFNLTSFVALKNAQCWSGGSAHSVDHEYLRVSLTDVSAWAWGKLQ